MFVRDKYDVHIFSYWFVLNKVNLRDQHPLSTPPPPLSYPLAILALEIKRGKLFWGGGRLISVTDSIIIFPVWLRNRWIFAGIEPIFSHTDTWWQVEVVRKVEFSTFHFSIWNVFKGDFSWENGGSLTQN